MADTRFLGKGLSYPLQINASGGFKIDINSVDTVRSSIIFLLHTRIGERPHRPETGTRLPDFKHEPNSPAIRAALSNEIKSTIVNNEPRVEDVRVSVESSFRNEREVLIKVSFIVIGENVEDNLVFPFYLGE